MNFQVYDFDATNIAPQQSSGRHPPGIFNFVISNTYLRLTKDEQGAMVAIEFKSEAGKITKNYNLFNKSEMAVKIAAGELAALNHATGVFKITFPKDQSGQPNMLMAAAELRGARGRMEVAPQTDDPNSYMEIKKVFDKDGNEPGKAAASGQGQAAAGWGNAAPAANAGATNGAAPTQVAPATQNPPAGWQAAPAGEAPPWAQK